VATGERSGDGIRTRNSGLGFRIGLQRSAAPSSTQDPIPTAEQHQQQQQQSNLKWEPHQTQVSSFLQHFTIAYAHILLLLLAKFLYIFQILISRIT
jgi:hypothetical protein